MLKAKPKARQCKADGCGNTYTSAYGFVKWCSPACGYALSQKKLNAAAEIARKAERKADKAKREAMKTRGDLIQEVQPLFNRKRRLEEHAKGMTCMSCQRPRHEIEREEGWKPGGAWDAGHFQSVGRKPELRFEPLNVWLQCKSCNAGSGKYAKKSGTVEAAFEANLRAHIGDELVDWLKGPHDLKHYSPDDLRAMKTQLRAEIRALQQETETA